MSSPRKRCTRREAGEEGDEVRKQCKGAVTSEEPAEVSHRGVDMVGLRSS